MRRTFILALLLLPLTAAVADECEHQASRNLNVDLAGVRGVQIQTHSYDLHLNGSGSTKNLELTGRACASSEELLSKLEVTQRREGDQLIIDTGSRSGFDLNLFGVSYAYLDLQLQLPANIPVTLDVGSGEVHASGLQQLTGRVSSGDFKVSGITGQLSASVGSGDVEVNDIGSLNLGSVGSGDFKAENIHGDARVGSVGSGDVELRQVGGSVRVDTLGSGDLTVKDVRGDFSVGAKGSGDVNHSGIGGKVSVPNDND
ncbi:MAG: DUF4097 family beta strand repeat-containing protein [Rhodanobacter sp.]